MAQGVKATRGPGKRSTGRRRSQDGLRLERSPRDLVLRHAWTIARGTSAVRTNVLVRILHAGSAGLGEAAPNPRYREDAASVLRALERLQPLLGDDPDRLDGILDRLEAAAPRDRSARAALDIALHDLAARSRGVPLHSLLGADAARLPRTSFSIGLDTIPAMQAKVREAEAYPVLKVKLGRSDDREVIEGIRAVTDKPLWVDANEAWSETRAVEMIRFLGGMGVALVEQPLPAADLEGARRVRARSGVPIFADEAVIDAADVPRIVDAYDGVNVKVQKAGGLRPARLTIEAARERGMKVMIGCMIETSIGITAAAHLAPLADHADLDGHLLLADDPFRGVIVREGRLILPEGPGLGMEGAW